MLQTVIVMGVCPRARVKGQYPQGEGLLWGGGGGEGGAHQQLHHLKVKAQGVLGGVAEDEGVVKAADRQQALTNYCNSLVVLPPLLPHPRHLLLLLQRESQTSGESLIM